MGIEIGTQTYGLDNGVGGRITLDNIVIDSANP